VPHLSAFPLPVSVASPVDPYPCAIQPRQEMLACRRASQLSYCSPSMLTASGSRPAPAVHARSERKQSACQKGGPEGSGVPAP